MRALARNAQPVEYLAHEFPGAHWEPQHSADVISALASVDCGFLGSATPLENLDAMSVPVAVQPLLQQMPPGPLAETVRDVARNQSLRRDLFQKQARALDAAAHLDALDAIVWAAQPGAPAGGALRFETRIGPVPGPAALFEPALQALAHGPQRFAALRALPAYASSPGLLNQVMQMLLWAGHAHPLRDAPAARTRPLPPLPGLPAHLTVLPGTGSAWAAPSRA